jgi:hypothetical protein
MVSKERYDKLKLKGLCTCCGASPPREGKTLCQHCADLKAHPRYNLRRLDKLRKQGLCLKCGKVKPRKNKSTCATCATRRIDYDKTRAHKKNLRWEVIKAYGGVCVCCGETTLGFLTLDHVNGGGNKHRKEMGGGGYNTYKWAKDNGYPDMLQVMCANCNLGRHWNGGICPHKEMES